MNAIEIIAAITAWVIVIKVLVILVNPKAWMDKVAKPIYENSGVSTFVFAVLTAIVGYYLLQVMSIVEIFAVAAFISLLMGLGALAFSKDVLKFAQEMMKKNGIKKAWLSTVIWAFLALWVLRDLYLR